MAYKHIKFDESALMRSFERKAVEKGLVKETDFVKTAAVKKADLKPTNTLLVNLIKLSTGLREAGFDKYADELESKAMLYKRSEKDGGEKLIHDAHPKGSHKLENIDDDKAKFYTIIDRHLKMLDVANKQPLAKLAEYMPQKDIGIDSLLALTGTLGLSGAIAGPELAPIFIPALIGVAVGWGAFEYLYKASDIPTAGQNCLYACRGQTFTSTSRSEFMKLVTDFESAFNEINKYWPVMEEFNNLKETKDTTKVANILVNLKKLNDLVWESRHKAQAIWSYTSNIKDRQTLGFMRSAGDIVAQFNNYLTRCATFNTEVGKFFTQLKMSAANALAKKANAPKNKLTSANDIIKAVKIVLSGPPDSTTSEMETQDEDDLPQIGAIKIVKSLNGVKQGITEIGRIWSKIDQTVDDSGDLFPGSERWSKWKGMSHALNTFFNGTGSTPNTDYDQIDWALGHILNISKIISPGMYGTLLGPGSAQYSPDFSINPFGGLNQGTWLKIKGDIETVKSGLTELRSITKELLERHNPTKPVSSVPKKKNANKKSLYLQKCDNIINMINSKANSSISAKSKQYLNTQLLPHINTCKTKLKSSSDTLLDTDTIYAEIDRCEVYANKQYK